jgi:hypothetical protein
MQTVLGHVASGKRMDQPVTHASVLGHVASGKRMDQPATRKRFQNQSTSKRRRISVSLGAAFSRINYENEGENRKND